MTRATLTEKLFSGAIRPVAATDFQTNEERHLIGQQIRSERMRIDLAAANFEILAVLEGLPAMSWALRTFYSGGGRQTAALKGAALRNLCEVIDHTPSAGAITAKINTYIEKKDNPLEFMTWGSKDVGVIVADNVALRKDIQMPEVPDLQTLTNIFDGWTGMPLLFPFENTYVEWSMPNRAAPGKPAGFITSLQVMEPEAAMSSPYVIDAINSVPPVLRQHIHSVVYVQTAADMGQYRLTSPTSYGVISLDKESKFLTYNSGVSPLAERLFVPDGEAGHFERVLANTLVPFLTLAWAATPGAQYVQLEGPSKDVPAYELFNDQLLLPDVTAGPAPLEL